MTDNQSAHVRKFGNQGPVAPKDLLEKRDHRKNWHFLMLAMVSNEKVALAPHCGDRCCLFAH